MLNLNTLLIRLIPNKLVYLLLQAALLIVLWGAIASPVLAQPGKQAVILQYHHISTTTPAITSISPENFQQHMNYLQENNFQILPLEQVIDSLKNGQTLPDMAAVITFDDGYVSVYTEAFPLLKELNWPFTIFVTTSLVDSNKALYADWQQINEMALAGATIANHTVSHPYFLEHFEDESMPEWRTRIRNEITQAEEEILQRTGQSHKLLAYPYGEYDLAVLELTKELDFIGIAQHSGAINVSSNFNALPRFPFSGIYTSMNSFPTKVKSQAFTVELLSPASPVTNEARPSAILNFAEGNYRLEQLACYNNNATIQATLLDAEEQRYQIDTHINNSSRRFRYNCTAPGEAGRYYWYSIPWVNPAIAE
ncbi:polysaccharide deacetylase family protein [Gammaproteobacteria bacterium]|nr:polysaccharide deacetylase family protein [Gammaproteobacteria bacterium]